MDTPESRAFVQLYRETYGRTPMITAALTYDAMQILFRAAQEQRTTDPEGIRTGIAALREHRGCERDYYL